MERAKNIKREDTYNQLKYQIGRLLISMIYSAYVGL